MNHSNAGLLGLAATLVLVSAASAAADAIDPANWRGDARFLVAAVDSIHPRPYRFHRRAAWDSAAAALEESLPTLRYHQAVAAFSRLLAMLEDGHSRLDHLRLASHGHPEVAPLPGPGFGATYPIESRVFADGLWIVGATSPQTRLLGTRVVAIDSRPVSDAVAAIGPFIPSDNSMWTLAVLPAFLRCPGYVSAAGLAPDPKAPLRLTVIDAAGRRSTVSVASGRPDSAAHWLSADDRTRAPLPLTRRLPGPFAYADLGDSLHTVFVRIREIVNRPGGEGMAAFVARVFAHVDSVGARRLILDLRGNGGGNNYFNQPLVHAVIRRPVIDRVGGFFVIVDRGTFSAAVSLAADLERETHAWFVGEPTGAAPNSPGDPAHVTLPASGLVVRISTVFWQGSDPRDTRKFIAPALPVMETWADWLNHRDPALAAIEAFTSPDSSADMPPNTHWGSRAQLEAQAPSIAW